MTYPGIAVGIVFDRTDRPARCGSSNIHTVWRAAWTAGFRVEPYRFGLSMILSLEAIFLSTL